jgi:hypothetical protein
MRWLFVYLFALTLAVAAAAGEWHVETVDSDGDVGGEVSLALDSSDYPHISYEDGLPNYDLKYARWNGSSWQIQTVDSAGSVGRYTSLVLDSSGRPHISYFDASPNYDLKYARWNGSAWQIETVDSEGGSDTSLALDSSGRPHISYCASRHLKYARWNGSSWQTYTVDSAEDMGMYSSLALDSSDRPHISYRDYGNDYLKYAHWDGDTWQIETVDYECYNTSLALDSSDRPYIVYGDEANCDLKYARWDGDDWHIEIVDSEGWPMDASLALDSNDYPHISYYDGWPNCDLKYARWNGSSWQIYTLDSAGEVGGVTSLALDSSGCPHISYNDYTNDDLKYAYWDGGPGVEGAEVFANTNDDGVLVGWEITGDAPAGLRVLRSAGEDEPVEVSGALPGEATRWLDADVEAGVEYCYWLETTDGDGTVSRFGPSEAVAFPGAARKLDLSVYPSPASGAFTVECKLPEDGSITIALYDLSGRRVSTVFDGETAAGRHAFSFDASTLTPGVYLVHLDADAGSLTRRVVITR